MTLTRRRTVRGRFLAGGRRTRTFVEPWYYAAPMAGHGIGRRWLAGVSAALVICCAAMATSTAPAFAGQPVSAHAASRTGTLIIHPAAVGRYEVIVWVRTRTKHAVTVKVYLTGQPVQTVRADPWWGARVYYTLNLKHKKLTVHTVNRAPAVMVRASLILKKAASSSPQVSTADPTVAPPTTTTTVPTPAPAPAPTPAPPALPPYSSFHNLFWQDTFAGAAGTAPSATNWRFDTGPSCNLAGCSVDTNDTVAPLNATVTGANQLAITAYQNGSGTTAAQMETQSALFHVGMEIDANIKFPAGQGLWGGFWLVQQSSACPECGELDVVEAPEMGPTPTTAWFTLHGPISGTTDTQQWEATTSAVGDLSAGFHTYGIIWTAGQIQYTIDGTVYATANPNTLAAGSQWSFDSGNYYLLLDLAVGGWPGPATAATQFPATMQVNWVRVYD